MSSALQKKIQNRAQELGILQRTPNLLKELVKEGLLDEKDSRLIKLVLLENKSMERADKIVNNADNPTCRAYYTAFGKFIQFQSQKPDAEQWLSLKYKDIEKVKKDLRKLAKTRSQHHAPKNWQFYFAATFYRLRNPPVPVKTDEFTLFKARFKRYLKGEVRTTRFKLENSGLYKAIQQHVGVSYSTFILNLFLEWLHQKKMPEESEARFLSGHANDILDNKNYLELAERWNPRFRSVKESMFPLEILTAKAYHVGITPEILQKVLDDSITRVSNSLVNLFRKYSSPKHKKKLKKIFEAAYPEEIRSFISELVEPDDVQAALDFVLKRTKKSREIRRSYITHSNETLGVRYNPYKVHHP